MCYESCPKCGAKMIRSISFKDNSTNYKCSKCSYQTNNVSYIKRHPKHMEMNYIKHLTFK